MIRQPTKRAVSGGWRSLNLKMINDKRRNHKDTQHCDYWWSGGRQKLKHWNFNANFIP